jgi:hypothetical protein
MPSFNQSLPNLNAPTPSQQWEAWITREGLPEDPRVWNVAATLRAMFALAGGEEFSMRNPAHAGKLRAAAVSGLTPDELAALGAGRSAQDERAQREEELQTMDAQHQIWSLLQMIATAPQESVKTRLIDSMSWRHNEEVDQLLAKAIGGACDDAMRGDALRVMDAKNAVTEAKTRKAWRERGELAEETRLAKGVRGLLSLFSEEAKGQQEAPKSLGEQYVSALADMAGFWREKSPEVALVRAFRGMVLGDLANWKQFGAEEAALSKWAPSVGDSGGWRAERFEALSKIAGGLASEKGWKAPARAAFGAAFDRAKASGAATLSLDPLSGWLLDQRYGHNKTMMDIDRVAMMAKNGAFLPDEAFAETTRMVADKWRESFFAKADFAQRLVEQGEPESFSQKIDRMMDLATRVGERRQAGAASASPQPAGAQRRGPGA